MSVLGVGIDLVEIARIERLLDRHPDRLPRRLLTDAEWDYCRAMAKPAQHVAARVAAKEAAFKALAGNALASRVSWKHLEVVGVAQRPPSLTMHGPAAERATELGVSRVLLSLTHSVTTAGAVVVLVSS